MNIDKLNPKQIVARGYDHIAEEHARWANRTRVAERARYTAVLIDNLPPNAVVLELGCGTGEPTTKQLAEHFAVTGVDISARHVKLARQNVPAGEFIHADMMNLKFPPASFDAVAAFYSIIHLPRAEQPQILQNIAKWLRPGGLVVISLGISDTEAEFAADWLGAPMFWSAFDRETNKHMVEGAGFEIISAREETEEEFGQPCTFLWIVARKLRETNR